MPPRSNRRLKAVAADPDPDLTVHLIQTKETVGAYRFGEIDDKGEIAEIADSVIGNIYVRKSALKAADIVDKPTGLTVSIAVKT